MHEISVIISNFNGAKWIPRLMETLREQRGVSLEIIVVDRNSTDGSGELLAGYPEVKVVSHPPETGLVCGYAFGYRSATKDLLFFMNEDMWLEPDCLRLTADAIDLSKRVGAAMPVQWTYDGQDVVNAGIWFAKSWWSRGIHPFRKAAWHLPRHTCIVPAANAGACLYHRASYEETGGWDISFFLDYEDGDLGLRMWQLDWHSVVVPEARLFHAVGASNSKTIASKSGAQPVSRKRYIEGCGNMLVMAFKSFTGAALVYPVLGALDRMLRNLVKLRLDRVWLDVLVFANAAQRLPAVQEHRTRMAKAIQSRPGQAYFTAPEFDISVLDGNQMEIRPVLSR